MKPTPILACLLLSVLALGSVARASAATPSRPNILVIVADDLGFHDVGYHGSEIRTPTLDALAASGVRLEQYYVFPTCSPTRTALLTSRNPSRFGVMGPIGGRSELTVPTETTTMADVLKSAGYATAISGKWHLGLRPEVGPRQYGFDSTYGYLHGQIDPRTHLYKNGDRTWHRNDVFLDEQGHATDLLAAEAVRWIETPREQPFFLYLAFSVPHMPLDEDSRWTAPYEGQIAEKSRLKFAAAVTHMDDAIGHVLAALDRSRQRDKTLVIFTSDNGGQQDHPVAADYGGKFGVAKVLGNNAPLRGWKGETYEGGIRVPALVAWPGVLTPREVTAPLSVLDWLPTVAALTQTKALPEWKWEGQDVFSVLAGSDSGGPRRFYWNTGKEVTVRDGNWKLIEFARSKQPAELYDLAADPLEKTDQAMARPEIVARLRELLAAQRKLDP